MYLILQKNFHERKCVYIFSCASRYFLQLITTIITVNLQTPIFRT